MEIVYSNEKYNQAAAFYLRIHAFVEEMGIDIHDEFDKHDKDDTKYLVIYENNEPIATARFQILPDDTMQPDRVCIAKNHRGKGFGEILITELEKQSDAKYSMLHAVLPAVHFYEKLGYEKYGDEFLEDGIPVIHMKKTLR